VVCSLALAAAISPWLHQGGKWLAAVAAARDLPGLLEWLAASCGRAGFGRYFDRSLLLAALLLLPLFLKRLRWLRATSAVVPPENRPAAGWPGAASQVVAGCVLAAAILWCLCLFLEWTGANEPKASSPSAGKFVSKVLVPALGASLIEEWLFRGVLLGLWLRFARPAAACAGSAALFAFLHFLKPPPGALIANPDHPLAGFELLGDMLLHYTEPRFFVTDFATLLAVGLILAWARLRTGALWFPIGLHAGWIMAFKACGLFYQKAPDHPLRPWGVGESLRSGMLPLLTLIVTAGICHFVMRRFDKSQPRITVTT
jgi:membrane protease YdiL (CAAX protease family)